eukprot:TRINITY_DN103457_c0_g1_i1.p1 TRINITY_DN103457_c0_g1~~TRINITY_DN103457_c0_g1_i1.p1  ORF type:complete len:1054 (+),score=155.21 TRINITY_DN103457_c0_g1_i1:170-3163(+)
MDAPLIAFVVSLFCCSLAVLVPIWLLRRCPVRGPHAHVSPSGFYVRWLSTPLHDARALRLDREKYKEHCRHFLTKQPKVGCAYCSHLTREPAVQAARPRQAIIYDGLQEQWERPCLHDYLIDAQRGAVSAAELCSVIRHLWSHAGHGPLRESLLLTERFASCLRKAETLKKALGFDEGAAIMLNGIFNIQTQTALCNFLSEQSRHEGSTLSMDRCGSQSSITSPWNEDAKRALQSYLKHQEYYKGPVDGILGTHSVRGLQTWLRDMGAYCADWLRDPDGEWQVMTTLALQRFLQRDKAGLMHQIFDGHWGVQMVSAFHDFLARCGCKNKNTNIWNASSTQALQKFLARSGYFVAGTCYRAEIDGLVCSGLQSWLRDQGFPCGCSGPNNDGVDGVFGTASKLALQLFLNSERVNVVPYNIEIDGQWCSHTISRLQEFLIQRNQLDVALTKSWDQVTRRSMQMFLKQQGHYVSVVDGDFGAVSVQSMQAWLRDEGFSCGYGGTLQDGVTGEWDKDTTEALQRYLNSRQAAASSIHKVQEPAANRPLQTAACYGLALFGGAKDVLTVIENNVLNELSHHEAFAKSNIVEAGREAAYTRRALAEIGLPLQPDWWGAGELLAHLHDSEWLQFVGSDAAVAAVRALECLEQVEQAPLVVRDLGIAQLLGHLQVGSSDVVEIVCEALSKLQQLGLLTQEAFSRARALLSARLRADPHAHKGVCKGLLYFPSIVNELWPALKNRLSSLDGAATKLAAEALGCMQANGLLPDDALSSSAELLAARFSDDDWMVRLGACSGIAAFGATVANRHYVHLVDLLGDDEGPVVAAAARSIRRLWPPSDSGSDSEKALRAVEKLVHRLQDQASDHWIRAGACEGLGSLRVCSPDILLELSNHLTYSEVIVVEAAARALGQLQKTGNTEVGVAVTEQARSAASRLGASEWPIRWAACSCLGALGATATPYVKHLEARMNDQDENGLVHAAARRALTQLGKHMVVHSRSSLLAL